MLDDEELKAICGRQIRGRDGWHVVSQNRVMHSDIICKGCLEITGNEIRPAREAIESEDVLRLLHEVSTIGEGAPHGAHPTKK